MAAAIVHSSGTGGATSKKEVDVSVNVTNMKMDTYVYIYQILYSCNDLFIWLNAMLLCLYLINQLAN